MKLLKNILLLIILLTFSIKLNAQDPVIDSLKLELKNAKHDSTRIKLLSELGEVCEVEDILKYAEPCAKLADKNASTAPNITLKKFFLKHLANAFNNMGFLAEQQGDIPKAWEYYNKCLKIDEEIKDKSGIGNSLNNIGFIYQLQGDVPKALLYFHKSLKIKEEIKDKEGIATALNNIGFIYDNQGDIPKALEYYHKSLKIREEIKDKIGIANSLNNIGTIYTNHGDILKALEYQHRSLKIQEEIMDKKGIAGSLNKIGCIYYNQGDIPMALEYIHKSLKKREEIKDKHGIAASLNIIGSIYKNQGDILKALEYYYISLKIREEIKDKQGIAESLNSISLAMLKHGRADRALDFAKRSLQTAKELGYPENIKNSATTLKKIYKKQNNYKEALKMYELEIQMNDSITNETTKKASVKKQFQYQYEKQAAADSVKNAEEQKVKNALLTAQQAQLKQEKTKSYALYGGLALVIVFAGFMFNRFKVTHKQKQIIELKEVETQKQNEIITHQKHLVEEKHKEITDSINYAERIQRSFLATKELLDENLNHRSVIESLEATDNYFVFFQPKDVVSGDFYWGCNISSPLERRQGVRTFILATADSTGHGVPGAIMSILNISCLEKSVEEEKLTEPSDILNYTRTKIIERLKKDGSAEGGKDGMDCSLICLKFPSPLETERFDDPNKINTNHQRDGRVRMTYAAANNPVWIVRKRHCEGDSLKQSQTNDEIALLPRNNETYELIELAPDKMPVGKHDKDFVPFTQHSIDLQKGDMVYALTDGFPDQFGGPKGKKFMYKQLKELLKANANMSMNQQSEILDNKFKEWKGNLEQVDDVTIIGIKI